MGDLVNLNKFRKKKAKAEKEKRAETNRRLHGRTRAEREREEAEKARLDKKVRGAFLEREVSTAQTSGTHSGGATSTEEASAGDRKAQPRAGDVADVARRDVEEPEDP